MHNPLVSIIVPVYNASKFLNVCIKTLVEQTYKNIEIILFDDGSKDSSFEVCKTWAEKDKRIKTYTQENQGVSITRLNAFEKSVGEYVTFVDSDDYVETSYIEKMLSYAQKYNVDVVSSQHYSVIDNQKHKVIRKYVGLYEGKSKDDLIENAFLYDKQTQTTGITVYLCTKLIKREFVRKTLQAGLNLWYGEDQAGVLQLLYDCCSVYVSHDYTYYYVIHNSQVTSIYKDNLLQGQIECWKRLKEIDYKHLLDKYFPIRIMLNLNNIISNKLLKHVHKFSEFKDKVKTIRNEEFLKDFFALKSLPLSMKMRIEFSLLKHKLFFCLYLFLLLLNKIR